MSVKITYKDPEDRPVSHVDWTCRVDHDEVIQVVALDLCVIECSYRYRGSKEGSVRATLDDAEAFFKAGLKLVEQQRRAQ